MPTVALRIRERREFLGRALLVELGEGAAEVDLAANLDLLRAVVDPVRDVLDRPQVLGHVLAGDPVARVAPRTNSRPRTAARSRSVDLRLGDEAQLAGSDVEASQPVVEPPLPGAELVPPAQGEHRLQVARLLEAVEGPVPPATRWVGESGVSRSVLGLQCPQLVEQRVVTSSPIVGSSST